MDEIFMHIYLYILSGEGINLAYNIQEKFPKLSLPLSQHALLHFSELVFLLTISSENSIVGSWFIRVGSDPGPWLLTTPNPNLFIKGLVNFVPRFVKA